MKNGHWMRFTVGAAAAAVFFAATPGISAERHTGRVHVQYAPNTTVKAASRTPAKPQTRKVVYVRHLTDDADLGGTPNLKSAAALVVDFEDGHTIYEKNIRNVTPIAPITKLMTAMVVLDADLPLEETIYIDTADLDYLKHTGSRLAVGTGLPRRDMLRLALMSSENRAAATLGRHYPGGRDAFVAAMNRKASDLAMTNTHFVDSTGLS